MEEISDKNYPWYPEITDTDFYDRLLNKKEFKTTRSPKIKY